MKITFLVSGSIRSNFSHRPLMMARSLHAQGHTVSIIAPKADKYNNFIAENISEIDGVKILQPFQFSTKSLFINLLPYIIGACKILLKEKPDLVYIYKPTPISAVGLLAKVFQKRKVITDFDDLGSEVMRIEGHPWYQRKLVAYSEYLTKKYSNRLIVASSYLLDLFTAGFPKKPILLLPNGVEEEWFKDIVQTNKNKRVVFMGSINRKSILDPLFDVLPNIIKIHPEIEVTIIGDGKFLNYFKEKAHALNISSYIVFMGWLKLEDAKTYLYAGDIGYSYMPDEITIKAANNMKVSQYMARGVVPIVSNLTDLEKAIESGNAGYIAKSEDVRDLERELTIALDDKERLNKANQAIALASQKFNWDMLAKNFTEWISPKKEVGNKKIYVVATSVPGDTGGGEIRNYNLIKQLIAQTDSHIEVFCISENNPEIESKKFESTVAAKCHVVKNKPRTLITILQALLIRRVPPYMLDFKLSGIGKMFRQACEESLPDIVHIEQLHAYFCIREHIPWLKEKGVKVIFDCHNIEFQSFKESLDIFPLPKRMVGHFVVPHLKKMEIEASKLSDAILACSSFDADFFKNFNDNTYIIPNGVNCSDFKIYSKGNKPTLIFMGGTAYPPNADGLQFYLKEIHPLVKEKVPEVEILAIGLKKPQLLEWGIHDTSITPLGFVEDIKPYLQKAAIGIAPIRYGSGTRIKIMTYMAAKLAVISTAKGAEGVEYTHHENIVIVDDPKAFANETINLLTDSVQRQHLAENGYNFILKNYDWNVIGKSLIPIYKK